MSQKRLDAELDSIAHYIAEHPGGIGLTELLTAKPVELSRHTLPGHL